MKEQIVSFDVAKLLKQLGFNIEVPAAYIGEELILNKVNLSGQDFSGYDCFVELEEFDENWNMNNALFRKNGTHCFGCKLDNKIYFEAYSAPTQALTRKWLRDIHNVDISITAHADIAFNACYEEGNDYPGDYKTYYKGYFLHNRNDWDIKKEDIKNIDFDMDYEEALEAGLHAALEYLKSKL